MERSVGHLSRPPVKVTFSDASSSACGAFVENSNLVFYQNWSPAESAQSSACMERAQSCFPSIRGFRELFLWF